MAKIERAYSIELGRNMDAIEANELWSENILVEKRAFECKDPNCEAQITCNNMDKMTVKMKRTPHFKCYGEHSTQCECVNDYIEAKQSSKKRGEGSDIAYKDNVDCFEFQRPDTHRKIQRNDGSNEKEVIDRETIIENKRRERSVQNSKHYSLTPIVTKYLKYGTHIATNYVRIYGNNIAYSELFWPITKISEKGISPLKRVYFGKGRLINRNDKYMVLFEDTVHEEFNSTAIYSVLSVIKKDLVNQYMFHNGKKQELEQAARSGEKYDIYLFGKGNKGYADKKTIFINIESLDHIDIR